MERLTIRNNDGTYSQPTKTTFEKLFYKVAEFEDFMEEQGFESLEELKQKLNKSFHVQECAERCGCEINGVFFESEQLMVLDAYKEFNTSYLKKYKDSQKENQAFQERLNRLKNWVESQSPLVGKNLCFTKEALLQKFEELEKESQNER